MANNLHVVVPALILGVFIIILCQPISSTYLNGRKLGGLLKRSCSLPSLEDKVYSMRHPGMWFATKFSTSLQNPTCFVAPDVCPNHNITFWMYTRETQNYPAELDVSRPDSFAQINSRFVRGAPWKIIIVGFTNDRKTEPATQLRNAFFKAGEYNIVTVDWSTLGRPPCYAINSLNILPVAKCTAQALDVLIALEIVPKDDFHVIGLSLATHMGGMIGKFLKAGPVPHLTGLEPAIVNSIKHPVKVLEYVNSPLSAKFFDVVHTNAGFYGIDRSLGDVDYWINGGRHQPVCNKNDNDCDHLASIRYYVESIDSNTGFYAVPCGPTKGTSTKQIIMGPQVDKRSKGDYCLRTNADFPYAQGRLPDDYIPKFPVASKIHLR